jgi:hypothetical protein
MHVSVSNVLLYMILYDKNCVSIYLVGLFLGILISYMNQVKMEYHLWSRVGGCLEGLCSSAHNSM